MKKIVILAMLIGFIIACNKNENFIDNPSQNIMLRSDVQQGYTDIELNLLLNTAAVSLFDYARNSFFVQRVFEKAIDTCSCDFASDVYCITAFILANGDEKCLSTHVHLKDVPEGDLNKWIKLYNHEVTHVDDRLVCPNEVLDFIIYEKDIRKASWQREFYPWKGVGTELGNKTYFFFLNKTNFSHALFHCVEGGIMNC
jgi:hypothetical protein